MASPRFGCVSLLSDESYAVGAAVTGWSLRRSGWPHETILMVTPEVNGGVRQRLGRWWQRIVEVDPIASPQADTAFGWSPAVMRYTKLQAWSLEEYERLVFIDADTLVTGPLEELLERPPFAAAPCLWPPDRFNSGVMVIEPSRRELERMRDCERSLPSYDGTDQGFLNAFYDDWFTGPPQGRLPAKFNASHFLFLYAPAWLTLQDDLRVIHFTGPRKPWKQQHRWVRVLRRRMLRRYTKVPGDLPTPGDLWQAAHDAMTAE